MSKKIFACVLTALVWFKVFAGDRGTIECYERDGEHRSTIAFSFEQTKTDIFRLVQKGRGDYDIHQNVTWETESVVELKDNIYRPLRSLRLIRDKDGRDIKELKLEYNYNSNIIQTRRT